MFIRFLILHMVLSSTQGFKISENFLRCNKKEKPYDLKRKCISENGLTDKLCLISSNHLKAIKHDEYAIVDSLYGKEIVYSNGKDIFETYCDKVNSIVVITNPEKCNRDLPIQYMRNDQSNNGFLTKNGIIRNNSLQEKCSNNYETFIKIKNFFIIKFKDKIIIKDEADIIKFELNKKNILFDYFEQLFKVNNIQNVLSFILAITIVSILIFFFSKKIKKDSFKIRNFFFKKREQALDESVIILESDHLQNRETNRKRKSKDKCVRVIDYNIDEVKINTINKATNTKSSRKSNKNNLNK